MHRGNGNTYGISTGLSRGQFFVAVFDRQRELKLTDQELVEMFQAEFPQCKTNFKRNISYYRGIYNRGKWPCQPGPPETAIPRYGPDGKVILSSNLPGPTPGGSRED